ncbi:PQQ-binding-like beta-propeller repeat protein [Paenibacillus sp. HJGM_3]|uniref:PQQ-binding-like beta-propeller repeat protein n=1 Tax=Paenibacillus sp. HJGM_3 TaxID=3379816 RepID=UPI00385835DF
MKRRWSTWMMKIAMAAVITMGAAAGLSASASAADMLIPNYSFESGLTGWTPVLELNKPKHEQKADERGCGKQVSTSTEKAYSGTSSLKLTGSPFCHSFGAESEQLDAVPGETYFAYARAYLEGRNAQLYIRFYDAGGKLLGTESAKAEPSEEEWQTLKVKAQAPPLTAYVTTMLYTDKANIGQIYFDDVLITKQMTNLGTQITTAAYHSAVHGKDASGRDVLYTVIDGLVGGGNAIPAKLAAVDVNSGQIKGTYPLPGASGGWGAVAASDGSIYVGTYSNGHLYRYIPGQSAAIDLGQPIQGESYVWALAAGLNGKVYGGTYPNAAVFEYDPASGYRQIGSKPVAAGEQYVRSIEYDPVHNTIYAGIGAHAKLVSLNADTGEGVEVLPDTYKTDAFVYNMRVRGDKLFATVARTYRTAVFDIAADGTLSQDTQLTGMQSDGVSRVYDGKVYFIKSGALHAYELESKTSTVVAQGPFSDAKPLQIVRLEDQVRYPGDTLVGIYSSPKAPVILKYNFTTGQITTENVEVPGVPTQIRSLASGPDGNIYTSGYLVGGAGIYTPMRSDLQREFSGVGQAEGMTAYGNKLYFGIYPRAKIYEFDATSPIGPNNPPKQVLDLYPYGQDRPFGMSAAEGKLFIGTVPEYGKVQGAVAIYDTVTGESKVYPNVVPNQGIVSTAYLNGYVYAGSLAEGGETSAKIAKINLATGESTLIELPVSGLGTVRELIAAPDGKIWGFAMGYFFILDPQTNTFDKFELAFPSVTATSQIPKMLIRQDGNVYGTLIGNLFRIDPTVKAIEVITDQAGGYLAQDEFGNLYYTQGASLIRYAM